MTKTITAMFGIAVFAAILFGSAVLAPQAFAGVDPPTPNEAGKVVICHNGDDGPETIEVSGNAVNKHIDKHGDTEGECIPDCADCSNNAEAEFNDCTNAGGSEAECFAQVEPSLTECALMCEESNAGDKDDACEIAALIQAFSCVGAGILTEQQCLDNATTFYEECTDTPV